MTTINGFTFDGDMAGRVNITSDNRIIINGTDVTEQVASGVKTGDVIVLNIVGNTGDITTNGRVEVQGSTRSVQARDVQITGYVTGDVNASRDVSTGAVHGNVNASRDVSAGSVGGTVRAGRDVTTR